MKIGCSIKIDVTKIDKTRLFVGKKGKYLDLTTFINLDEQGQYGHNGIVKQSVSKEERAGGLDLPILGDITIFYKDKESGKNMAEGKTEIAADMEDIPF